MKKSRQQAALLQRLVRLRADAGFDQTMLADRLGITQSEVSKFERGERALDLLRLRAWLRALGVELAPFAAALDRELEQLDDFAGSEVFDVPVDADRLAGEVARRR